MGAGHNIRERRLFGDIIEKNRLANRIRKLGNAIQAWRGRLRQRQSRRWRAQYARSIHRYALSLDQLQAEVLRKAQNLRARIQQEIHVSDDEIKQFHEQYKTEVAELKAAETTLEEARRAVVEAEVHGVPEVKSPQHAAVILANLRRAHRRRERRTRVEAKDVRSVQAELASEAKDKVVLAHELRRAVEEIEALAP